MQNIKKLVIGLGLVLALSSALKAQQVVDDTRLFDAFEGANWEAAMARLDNFALKIQNNPNAIGVLIVYGGQRRKHGEAQAWSACLKDYLVNRRGINANRIVMVNGGYREKLTVELWETADKNHIPNLEPHIKLKDVRFKGGRIRKWRRLCNI